MNNNFGGDDSSSDSGLDVTRREPVGAFEESSKPQDHGSLVEREVFLSNSDRGGIVAARGTGDGLVLRLDGRVEVLGLKSAVVDFIESRRAFLSGQEVILEWVGSVPPGAFVNELMGLLASDYSISVKASRILDRKKLVLVDSTSDDSASSAGERDDFELSDELAIERAPSRPVRGGGSARAAGRAGLHSDDDDLLSDRPASLFDGVQALNKGDAAGRGVAGPDPLLWDEPDARILFTTLRSGQKVESEHSIVVVGDVNSGAEIISGGDVIVLGTLRGIAHAGAYDETGGGRIVFALNLQPTQLRIGMVISRGAPEGTTCSQPEVARVDGSLIVVESYNPKNAGLRRGVR